MELKQKVMRHFNHVEGFNFGEGFIAGLPKQQHTTKAAQRLGMANKYQKKHPSLMTRVFTFLLLLFFAKFASGQTTINLTLKNKLDSIFQLDQKYRLLLISEELKSRPDSLAKSYGVETSQLQNFLITKMVSIDSSNIKRVDEIIAAYGYPGKSLVGEPANEAAFFVIQHSQSIAKFLPLIKKAAQKKELLFSLYAMMLDRSLMYSGKEQVYGTQGSGFQALNATTGQKEFKMVIWPIKNHKKVNKRRKKAGFKDTVEENSKRMGITYIPYTIGEINKMKAK